MKRLIFTPAAADDLEAIAAYIAEDNPIRAEQFVGELEAKARQIVEWPRSFPEYPEISPGLRAARHGRYLIFFRDLEAEVRVIRVLHGARDLPKLIEP